MSFVSKPNPNYFPISSIRHPHFNSSQRFTALEAPGSTSVSGSSVASQTESLNGEWFFSKPPRITACHAVERFGPIPETVVCPKLQAPEGSRYCEELDAFVPEGLSYRIRGIGKTNSHRTSFSARIFPGFFRKEREKLVMAMGLTHAKLKLIPLSEAQRRKDIVYHSVDTSDNGTASSGGSDSELISLFEARGSPETIYRTLLWGCAGRCIDRIFKCSPLWTLFARVLPSYISRFLPLLWHIKDVPARRKTTPTASLELVLLLWCGQRGQWEVVYFGTS